jgi:hypothetical protein
MATILWRSRDPLGMERCVLTPVDGGYRLAGTALLHAAGEAHEIRYSVITDAAWRTTTVGAHVQSGSGDRRMALHADGEGAWSVGDTPVLELYGAVDVDLAWTPATNSLPLARLDIAVGESAEVTVAHIDFPGHDVSRKTQRYTRVGSDTYRYESEGYTAELTLRPDGLVGRYGDLWDEVSGA